MSYCTVRLVRKVVDLPEAIGDEDIRDLRDDVATPTLNEDMNTQINEEEVFRIDNEKQNTIDGSNKTFYARAVHESTQHIGDKDDDGVVDGDDISAYWLDGSSNRNTADVTLDDAEIGKMTITKSGTSDPIPGSATGMWLNYEVAPVDVSSPHPMVSVACAFLTGAYCFSKIDTKEYKEYSVGDFNLNRHAEGFQDMWSRYQTLKRKIIERDLVQMKDNVTTTEDVFHEVNQSATAQ